LLISPGFSDFKNCPDLEFVEFKFI
jgi:hypothetical protein